MERFAAVYAAFEAFPAPTVAVCVGNCVGGGRRARRGLRPARRPATTSSSRGRAAGSACRSARRGSSRSSGSSRAKELDPHRARRRRRGGRARSACSTARAPAAEAEAAALELAARLAAHPADGMRRLKGMFRESRAHRAGRARERGARRLPAPRRRAADGGGSSASGREHAPVRPVWLACWRRRAAAGAAVRSPRAGLQVAHARTRCSAPRPCASRRHVGAPRRAGVGPAPTACSTMVSLVPAATASMSVQLRRVRAPWPAFAALRAGRRERSRAELASREPAIGRRAGSWFAERGRRISRGLAAGDELERDRSAARDGPATVAGSLRLEQRRQLSGDAAPPAGVDVLVAFQAAQVSSELPRPRAAELEQAAERLLWISASGCFRETARLEHPRRAEMQAMPRDDLPAAARPVPRRSSARDHGAQPAQRALPPSPCAAPRPAAARSRDIVLISARPPSSTTAPSQATARAICSSAPATARAIVTLVERQTRYVLLARLGADTTSPSTSSTALSEQILGLPRAAATAR